MTHGNTTHGHTSGGKTSREMKAWGCAKARCYNPKDKRYKTYGARGITMCAEWRNDFSRFLQDMGPCPPGYTLDRVDNNGPYNQQNCRWASRGEQARNKTTNLIATWNGRPRLLKDIARETGLTYATLRLRVKYKGQDVHDAVRELKVKMGRLGRI